MGTVSNNVMNLCGYIACGFLGVLAVIILIWIWQEKIDLRHLLDEANGQASMSRFQLLIFTFVVAIGMFELIEKTTPPGFPVIPSGVLTLLGISASTYAVGKGISYSQPDLLKPPDGDAEKAKEAADEAQAHADAAKNSADSSKVAADKSAGHMQAAQSAAQQTAQNAATAQQAADKATGAA